MSGCVVVPTMTRRPRIRTSLVSTRSIRRGAGATAWRDDCCPFEIPFDRTHVGLRGDLPMGATEPELIDRRRSRKAEMSRIEKGEDDREMPNLLGCRVVNAADVCRRPPVDPEDVASSDVTRLEMFWQGVRQ